MSNKLVNNISRIATPTTDKPVPKYIVGIGASAGGLESLETMFQNMPATSGMSFVVVQHLSPDFKSMMSELLARDTTMRIVVVEDGVRLEENVIYTDAAEKGNDCC